MGSAVAARTAGNSRVGFRHELDHPAATVPGPENACGAPLRRESKTFQWLV